MLKVIESFDKDNNLQSEWNRLFGVCQYVTPFQTFDFVSTIWKYISSKEESLYIIVAVDDRTNEYKAIFPMSIDTKGVVRFICQDYIDFCSAIVNPIHDNYTLYEEVGKFISQAKNISEVNLLNLKHDNPLLSTLTPFVSCIHVKECSYYSTLPIFPSDTDKDFLDSMKSLNAKKKKNLRRDYCKTRESNELFLFGKKNGNPYPQGIVYELTTLMINKGIRSKDYFSGQMLELWNELYDKGVMDIAVLYHQKKVKSVNFVYKDRKCSEVIKWIMVYEDNIWNKSINLMIAEHLYNKGGYTINFARGIYDYKLVNFHPNVKTLFNVTISKNRKSLLKHHIMTTKVFIKDLFKIQ